MESPAERSAERTALISDVATILPGEFHLLDYLGEGGHGIVFKAIFKPLQSQVALKLIKQDDPERMERELERMQNEARILAKLQHPNIVRVFQMAKCTDGTPFLVCEYVQGQTLGAFLENNGPMDLQEIRTVFSQILDALQVSHDHGLIHRDIKPNNIILSREKPNAPISVKVLDFGIARDLSEANTSEKTSGNTTMSLGLTRTIQVTGSAPYMSPEQCRGVGIDPRTDLYSVACVLYECLSGRPPFIGETPIHTRYMHIHETPKQPSENTDEQIREKGSLYKLVLKALSKDPSGRPQTAEQFKKELLDACAISKFDRSARKRKSLESAPRSPYVDRRFLLLGAILISTIIFGCYLIFSIKNNQKSSDISSLTLHKSTSKIPHGAALTDPHNLLASARKDLEKAFNQGKPDFESRKLCVEGFEKVEKAIKKIDKKDNTLQFLAWSLRGSLASALDLTEEKKSSYEKALQYCKLDGRQTLEATQCYQELAAILIHKDDPRSLDQAEPLVKKVIEIRLKNESEEIPSLPVPTDLETRDKITELIIPYEQLGDIARRRGHLDEAIKYGSAALDERVKIEGLSGTGSGALELATRKKDRSPEEAKQFIRKYLGDLLNAAPDLHFIMYESVLAWTDSNLDKSFAQECRTRVMEGLRKAGYRPAEQEKNAYEANWQVYKKSLKSK